MRIDRLLITAKSVLMGVGKSKRERRIGEVRLLNVETIWEGSSGYVRAREEESGVCLLQGAGRLFPFFKSNVGKRDRFSPSLDVLKDRLSPDTEKRGELFGNFFAKAFLVTQGKFGISLSSDKSRKQDFARGGSSGKKGT